MSHRIEKCIVAILVSAVIVSCSTVKVIPEESYRLTANVVNITDKSGNAISSNDISSYITQKPNSYFFKGEKGGWNPFVAVYNWENGKGKGWDRFVHKIGQAPVILDTSKISKSEENICRHLEYLGHYDSSTEGVIVPKGSKKAYVRYDVFPGKTYPISSVRFDICDSLLMKDYLADTSKILVRPGAILSEKLLESESERAALMLNDMGWYGFTKNYFFFEADTTLVRDSALVTVFIMKHTRNESEKSDIQHTKYKFGEVNIYPVSDAARYRTAMAMKISLNYDTVKVNGVNVLYDGKPKFRPSSAASMNTIVKGEYFSEKTVSNTYQRYSNIRSFSSVSVQVDKTDSNTVDCSIILLPQKTNGYKLNLEVSASSNGFFGVAPTISYFNRNIFHGGEWFTLSGKGNFQFKFNDPTRAIEVGAAAGLSLPTFVLLPDRIFKTIVPRTDINLTYNFQQRPEYTRHMIGGTYGYAWNRFGGKLALKVNPAQINIVHMSDMSDEFRDSISANLFLLETYKSQVELGGGLTVNYSSVPELNPKVSHLKAMFAFDIAGNIVSLFNGCMGTDSTGAHTIWGTPYAQFVRAESSITYNWHFGKKNNQALVTRFIGGFGYAYGNGVTLPFERQFWVGGANSMRGWQARALGPGAWPDVDMSIPSQTGSVKLEANLEYRFPIVWKFNGALFFDAGNVWFTKRELENGWGDYNENMKDYAISWKNLFRTSALNTGFGLRLDLSMVVIRFDLGIKLYDPMDYHGWRSINTWFRNGGYAIQFGIGYPF